MYRALFHYLCGHVCPIVPYVCTLSMNAWMYLCMYFVCTVCMMCIYVYMYVCICVCMQACVHVFQVTIDNTWAFISLSGLVMFSVDHPNATPPDPNTTRIHVDPSGCILLPHLNEGEPHTHTTCGGRAYAFHVYMTGTRVCTPSSLFH